MKNVTTKTKSSSQKVSDWAKWEVAFQTRAAAEHFGKTLSALGYKTSITGIFDPKVQWIIQTAAPLDKMTNWTAAQ